MHLTTSFDFPHPTQLVERFNLFNGKMNECHEME